MEALQVPAPPKPRDRWLKPRLVPWAKDEERVLRHVGAAPDQLARPLASPPRPELECRAPVERIHVLRRMLHPQASTPVLAGKKADPQEEREMATLRQHRQGLSKMPLRVAFRRLAHNEIEEPMLLRAHRR